jgi:hypothetical protein
VGGGVRGGGGVADDVASLAPEGATSWALVGGAASCGVSGARSRCRGWRGWGGMTQVAGIASSTGDGVIAARGGVAGGGVQNGYWCSSKTTWRDVMTHFVARL